MRNTVEIRDTIDAGNFSMSETVVMDADVAFQGQPLTHLKSSTQYEVRDIIMRSPSKSRVLDPLDTYLLKQVLEQALPLITGIIKA